MRASLAPRVKAVCEEYGLPYNSGPFWQQWLMVQRTIARLAFPGGEPRPKAPPYTEPQRPSAPHAGEREGRDAPLRVFP